MQLTCIIDLLLVILQSMRQFLLFSVLLGMVLIHAPKSFLHKCAHQVHECHSESNFCHSDHHDDGPTFYTADCDLCSYSFHSIDTPSFSLIRVPSASPYATVAMKPVAFSIGAMHHIHSRGPPIIVTI